MQPLTRVIIPWIMMVKLQAGMGLVKRLVGNLLALQNNNKKEHNNFKGIRMKQHTSACKTFIRSCVSKLALARKTRTCIHTFLCAIVRTQGTFINIYKTRNHSFINITVLNTREKV